MAPPAKRALADREPHAVLRTVAQGDHLVIAPDLKGPIDSQEAIVKVVCRWCNNGWMAELEAEAKPILLGLERGTREDVDRESADVLALWAAKTGAMFLHADWETRAMTRAQLVELYTARRPPAGVAVWIGRIADHPAWKMRLRTYAPRIGLRDTPTSKPRWVGQVSSTSLALDTVLFQVLTVSDSVRFGFPVMPGPLVRLWPRTDSPLAWPLPEISDADAFSLAMLPLTQYRDSGGLGIPD